MGLNSPLGVSWIVWYDIYNKQAPHDSHCGIIIIIMVKMQGPKANTEFVHNHFGFVSVIIPLYTSTKEFVAATYELFMGPMGFNFVKTYTLLCTSRWLIFMHVL